MSRRSISPSAFLERLKPYMSAYYQTALLITDDDDAAEEALGEALMDAYLEDGGGDRQAQREKLRRYVRVRSLERAGRSGDGLYAGRWRLGMPGAENVLYDALTMMPTEAQRFVMLRGFAGISQAKAASLCGIDQNTVNDIIRQALASVPDGSERMLIKMCRDITVDPDMTGIERLFERDAVTAVRGRHRSRSIPAIVLSVIGIIICMFLFWVITVLLEPSEALAFVKILSAV